jgi:4'-phosphopantetheinyl transferase
MSQLTSRVAPGPGASAVDVWVLGLDVGEESAGRLRSWLCASELEREARLRCAHDRHRFAVAHGLLRHVLACHYAACAPGQLALWANAEGKPEMQGPLRFSFSHSDDLALLAVSAALAVGVDVERVRPVADPGAAAELAFSPVERAALGSCDDRTFLRAWSRREAYVKGRGEGIAAPLAADAPEARAEWTLLDLDPAPGYVGALAVRCPAPELRHFHLGGRAP